MEVHPVSLRSQPVRVGTRRGYAQIFFGGLVLWVATILVVLLTRNANLIPTLILLGSFLVPVSFVVWAFERWRDEHLTTDLIIQAFAVGGLLGVLGAAVLESYLLRPSPMLFVGVGLIEEGVKLAALIFVARHMTRRHTRDGIVLGAAVGFGFAAFESAGYAFNAMFTMQGLSLIQLVQTELLRGILAPVGHGLWTAILGGVLFRVAAGGRFRFSVAVLGTYLWVSLLHALWDSMHGIALVLTLLLTGTPWQYQLLRIGYLPEPTPGQVKLFTALSIGGLVVVSVFAILTLVRVWRSERREVYPAVLAVGAR
jgi:RsiW-degrading membrane proteinase PrsW (M82 family)